MKGYQNSSIEYQMPDLDEREWDKIINNVSLVSFMQGLPLRNKLYRGYSVVTNTQSKEFVDPDEIYLIQDGSYHKITWRGFDATKVLGVGYRNVDFNIKYVNSGSMPILPHHESECYESIVAATNVYGSYYDATTGKFVSATQNALNSQNDTIKNIYYRALYRERYVNYKSLNFGI